MSKRDRLLLVKDMIESCEKILLCTEGLSLDDFIHDDKTKDAVIRNFEIVGEASIRIDDDYKRLNPQIEWKSMRGFRNRVVHDYIGIDYEIVWEIINSDIEELLFQLNQLK
jgi:uncharacterized protein with HEPN domain